MLWWFLIVFVALTPLIMLLCGRWFLNRPPIYGDVFGYRSARSCKSEQAWQTAHRICGQLWFRLGELLLMISTIAMLFVHGQASTVMGYTAAVLMLVQVLVLLATIPLTERQLKQRFDENGKPRA